MLKLLVGCAAVIAIAGCQTTRDEKLTVEEGAKEVCRSITDSGSILPRRICHNKATWAEIDKRDEEVAKENMDKMQGRYAPIPRDGGL
jgi:uncharacterized lipoprotein YehR (DUF1307 family)